MSGALVEFRANNSQKLTESILLSVEIPLKGGHILICSYVHVFDDVDQCYKNWRALIVHVFDDVDQRYKNCHAFIVHVFDNGDQCFKNWRALSGYRNAELEIRIFRVAFI